MDQEIDATRLAVAQNVATNGRTFLALVALADMAGGHLALAILAALPIGLSCFVDPLPCGRARGLASLGVYALSAVIALASLIKAL